MSLQQSNAEKNESQLRKLGRSSGAGHYQQTLKGAEVGGSGPHSSSNRSVKQANGPVGQSRGNFTAGHPQPNSIPKIQNGGHTQRQQTGGNPTAESFQPNVNVKSQNGGNTQRQQTGGNPTQRWERNNPSPIVNERIVELFSASYNSTELFPKYVEQVDDDYCGE